MSDSPDIVLERSLYYGVIFMSICYGLLVYMYAHSVNLFLKNTPRLRRQRHVYMAIGTVSVVLCTVAVFANIVYMEFMWIEHRDAPGGPLGYFSANSSVWFETFGTASNQVQNFLADGLLIYRCYIIWQGSRSIIIFPILLYLGSIAMAIVTLVQSALPGSQFFQGKAVNFGVPWIALTVSLNIFVTAMITTRLLFVRHRFKNVLPAEALNTYTGISAILIESALPFSVLGIIFAVTYGNNLSVGPAFAFVWGTFSSISPQFIIFRVVVGKSWTRDLISQATSSAMTEPIRFKVQDLGNINKNGGSTTFVGTPSESRLHTEM